MRDHSRHLLITLCLSLVFLQVLVPPGSDARATVLEDWCRTGLDFSDHSEVVCEDCCANGIVHAEPPPSQAAHPNHTTSWALHYADPPGTTGIHQHPEIRGPPQT